MASRRLRIKAVANLPVRRGRGTASDQPKNENADDKKLEGKDKLTSTSATDTLINSETTDSDILEKEGPVLKIVDNSSCVIHKYSLSNFTADTTLNNSNAQAQVSNQSTSNIIENDFLGDTNCDNLSVVHTIEINTCDTIESKEMDQVGSNMNIDCINKIESAPMQNKLPLKFVRKRVKPTVTLSAAIKRPRKVELLVDLKNSKDSFNTIQTDHQHDQLGFVSNPKHVKIMEDTNSTHLRHEPESLCQVARVVGVPEPTQAIPTGTAIVQVTTPGDDLTASPPLESNGEDPQLLPEPDLPSEGAGGDNVMPKFCTPSRSRFARPSPRIPDPCVRKAGTVRRLSESDDGSRKTGIMPTLCGSPIRTYCEANKAKLRPTPKVPDSSIRGVAIDEVDHGLKPAGIMPGISELLETKKELESFSDDENGASTIAGDSNIESSPDGKSMGKRKTSESQMRRGTSKLRQRMLLAQKEFSTKFGNQAPDRSRLTMFDLIYYNPITNPMKSVGKLKTEIKATTEVKPSTEIKIISTENTKPVESVTSTSIFDVRLSEENVDDAGLDDPVLQEDFKDEDITLAVPQVKVGPDGQIIIDEKSLVIETTGAKKSREELANSTVVVEYGTGSGSYGRKSKKSRCEWSKQETLKFYRALNTIGTDFLLMQSIFPNRTRQDLKVKFKREDRINRELVDKALRNPLDFDLTDLETDLVKEQKDEQERQRLKLAQKLIAQTTKPKKRKTPCTKSRSFANRSMDKFRVAKLAHNLSLQQQGSKPELGWEQQSGLGDFAGENSNTDPLAGDNSDDDSESVFLSKEPRPTKSGRVPMRNKYLVCSDQESLKAVAHIRKPVLPDMTGMQPGSLVVLTSPSPHNPNEMIYKVFMVPPAQSVPVQIAPPSIEVTQEAQVLDFEQC